MYQTNIAQLINHQKIFEAGVRLLGLFTLSIKTAMHKKKNENNAFSYFFDLIEKGSTVLDIGKHSYDYLYIMQKIAKRSGRLIAFEAEPDIYNYISDKKEILRCKNIIMEYLPLPEVTGKTIGNDLPGKRKEATVINFKTRVKVSAGEGAPVKTIDAYCIANNVVPDFLRINGEGNEAEILNGAVEILRKYKPKILLQCEERHAGRINILKTFKLLTDLKYSGYFILDDMKLPLSNFDFAVYQNPLSNFYCKDFIFK